MLTIESKSVVEKKRQGRNGPAFCTFDTVMVDPWVVG